MHFVVSIINKLTGNELHETIAQPEYIYQRRDYVHCSAIIFKIAAVNQVGRSEFSDGIEAEFAGRMLLVKSYSTSYQKHINFLYFPSVLCLNTTP